MREQASQIDVAPFADPSQVPTPAGRRLTRREAEPTGKLPAAPKRVNVPDARDERRRRQHADPGDLLQAPRDGMLASNCGELVIDRGDARVERTDFVEQQPDGMAHEPGQVHRRIVEQRRNALQRGARPRTKRQTKLAQDATHHVDPSRPRRLPLRSNAMQGLNRLLFRGFHCRRRVHRKWLCFSGCVESKRSAVAYRTGGAEYERRLSLSFSPRSPSFRFPAPLIEPDVTISVIPSVAV